MKIVRVGPSPVLRYVEVRKHVGPHAHNEMVRGVEAPPSTSWKELLRAIRGT